MLRNRLHKNFTNSRLTDSFDVDVTRDDGSTVCRIVIGEDGSVGFFDVASPEVDTIRRALDELCLSASSYGVKALTLNPNVLTFKDGLHRSEVYRAELIRKLGFYPVNIDGEIFYSLEC